MKLRFFAVSCCTILLATPVSANWYEMTGQAKIEQGDTAAAKQAAIADALERAALFAGVRITSEQQLVAGVMQQHQLTLDSNSEIREIRLLRENYSNDYVTITLQAEILPGQQRCVGSQQKKPLLLARIELGARHDAVHGQLFKLDENATAQLSRHLLDYSPAVVVNTVDYSLQPDLLTQTTNRQLFNDGQQFVLVSQITDLSLGKQTNRFWQNDRFERFFALDVALYDAFNNQLLFTRQYRTQAQWNSELTIAGSHSQQFWQQPYGQKIDTVLKAVAKDIQQHTQCQSLLAQISHIDQHQIAINKGSRQGLQRGDSVTVMQIQRFAGKDGLEKLHKSPVKLNITDISSDNAWASADSPTLLSHLQTGDLISISSTGM
ncbi:flagellar assembly protein T N-terminal domain-containing protein [Arsukibacterium sp.]|uniref:flagellar assembly protein T N-terminal domain-containing protein n=1 Tax=Arsukibacterium sp. TaxID=1977258 RepID=UPI00299CD4D9|nr:flagellar assembly protein T N-terminal domain-containing protein [Arsukibacterium sp.]MDX1678845.1 flagellar assembly protein T N-terminal domain-containing protein [Arsukibacterium sp.]